MMLQYVISIKVINKIVLLFAYQVFEINMYFTLTSCLNSGQSHYQCSGATHGQ